MSWLDNSSYDGVIVQAANAHGVPPELLKALVARESSFDPHAYRSEPSRDDASRGLTQILAATARGLGYDGTDNGLYDPATNLDLGAAYLAEQRSKAGNWAGAVSAYNGGWRPQIAFGMVAAKRGIVCNSLEVPVGQFCNQKYVDDVMGYWTYYRTGKLPDGGHVVFAGLGPIALLLAGGALLGAVVR